MPKTCVAQSLILCTFFEKDGQHRTRAIGGLMHEVKLHREVRAIQGVLTQCMNVKLLKRVFRVAHAQ